MSRIFVVKAFDRWLRKQEIEDADLIEATELADRGIVRADLGGGLVKIGIPREGGGKSSGYRTIVAFRRGERSFYLSGFAKNEKDNITEKQAGALKVYGKALQALDERGLDAYAAAGEIREVVREQ